MNVDAIKVVPAESITDAKPSLSPPNVPWLAEAEVGKLLDCVPPVTTARSSVSTTR